MKEAYYFSHDANARHDPKIVKMMLDLQATGYGIYWVIIEMLRNEPEYKLGLHNVDAIAYQSHCDRDTVIKVIEDYDLFELLEGGQEFWSMSLLKRMEEFKKRSESARNSAQKRWSKYQRNAKAMPTQCEGNAVKESKVKESKEKNIVPPTFDMVLKYCEDRKNGVDAKTFINHYETSGWMRGKNKIKDWQAAVRTWEKSDSKPKTRIIS